MRGNETCRIFIKTHAATKKGIHFSVVKPEGKRPLRNTDKDGMLLELVPD
jgi:hypothetical protein